MFASPARPQNRRMWPHAGVTLATSCFRNSTLFSLEAFSVGSEEPASDTPDTKTCYQNLLLQYYFIMYNIRKILLLQLESEKYITGFLIILS